VGRNNKEIKDIEGYNYDEDDSSVSGSNKFESVSSDED